MKRTDEAFKREIFRRYEAEKRNRHNLAKLAVMPLVLTVVLTGVLAIPAVFGSSLSEVVGSLFDRSPLADYLSEDYDKITIDRDAMFTEVAFKDEDTLHTIRNALLKTKLTQCEMPQLPYRLDRGVEEAFDLRFYKGEELLFSLFFDNQYLVIADEDITKNPELGIWYEPDAEDVNALFDTLRSIYFGSSDVMPLPIRTIEDTKWFAEDEIPSAMNAAVAWWEKNQWPDQYLTVLKYSDGYFSAAYKAQYGVSEEEFDTHFSGSPQVIYLYCEWQRVINPNEDGPMQSYLKLEKQNGEWTVTEFYPHWGIKESPLADDLEQKILSISLSSSASQSTAYTCTTQDEISRVVEALLEMTLIETENVKLSAQGPAIGLQYQSSDGSMQLRFDPSGYMQKIRYYTNPSATGQQWYKVPVDEVAAFTAMVNEIMYGTQAPPVTEYPTLEDLLTFLHPTANAMYVYPKPASSIRYEYSGTGEEIAHVLTSLRDMAPALDSTSLPTDPPDMTIGVEWFLDEYSVIVRLAPDSGLIRYYLLSPDGEQLTTALYSAPAADVAALTEYLEGLMDESSAPRQ